MLVDNTDQIKLALTMATRKRSITQQVHFSAEGSKSLAMSALRDLCSREQEISPHTDSRDMEPLYDKQHERSKAQTVGIALVIKKSKENMNDIWKMRNND